MLSCSEKRSSLATATDVRRTAWVGSGKRDVRDVKNGKADSHSAWLLQLLSGSRSKTVHGIGTLASAKQPVAFHLFQVAGKCRSANPRISKILQLRKLLQCHEHAKKARYPRCVRYRHREHDLKTDSTAVQWKVQF